MQQSTAHFHPLHEQNTALNMLPAAHKGVFATHFTLPPGSCLCPDLRQRHEDRSARRGNTGSLDALACGRRTINFTCSAECMHRLVTLLYTTFDIAVRSAFATDEAWQLAGESYLHTKLTWLVGSVLASIIQQMAVIPRASRRTAYHTVSDITHTHLALYAADVHTRDCCCHTTTTTAAHLHSVYDVYVR